MERKNRNHSKVFQFFCGQFKHVEKASVGCLDCWVCPQLDWVWESLGDGSCCLLDAERNLWSLNHTCFRQLDLFVSFFLLFLLFLHNHLSNSVRTDTDGSLETFSEKQIFHEHLKYTLGPGKCAVSTVSCCWAQQSKFNPQDTRGDKREL